MPASAWPLQRYRRAAYHLGKLQGSYLTGRPLPDHAWLTRNWLRARMLPGPDAMDTLRDPRPWQHPLIRRAFPAPVVDAVLRLWADREMLLAGLDRQPTTLCHQDLYPPNLFARRGAHGDDQPVLIDWSYIGLDPAGQDIGNLVPDSVWMGYVPADDLAALEQLVWDGYLMGLAAAGWRGDERVVRFGYAASLALGYSFMPRWMLALAADETRHAVLEQQFNSPIQDELETRAAVVRFALERGDEACRLCAELAR